MELGAPKLKALTMIPANVRQGAVGANVTKKKGDAKELQAKIDVWVRQAIAVSYRRSWPDGNQFTLPGSRKRWSW